MTVSPVSVIICTYNRAVSLEKCLQAIARQDYPGFEVVVVNGPSTDNTETIATKYGARVVAQQGRGIANARNAGVRAANGEIIAFVDDDCTVDPDWLKQLVSPLQDPGVSGAGGKAIRVKTGYVEFENGTVDIYGRARSQNPSPGRGYEPRGAVFNNIVCMNVAFRKAAVLSVGGFDEYFNNFYEETDLCVRLIQAGYKVVHQPAAVVYHDPAEGPNRRSRWDQNWYVISRNSTCMPFKNFDRGHWRRVGTLGYLYIRRLVSFLIPLFGREITLRELAGIYKEATRGYLDGMRDGLRYRKARKK